VRFRRPGLTEEYSVSLDGVRQDFIVGEAPPSPPAGELVVKLAVAGAQVEAAADGARLVLDHSGRKIAYSRLRVTDATGRELPARMEVTPVEDDLAIFDAWVVADNDMEDPSLLTPAPARAALAVVVNDAAAVYPVRIDPTFSDANWVSMGSLPGASGAVEASVTDGSGHVYIGGTFNAVGNTVAINVAEWNGSSWSALGSGISGVGSDGNGPVVNALAVSGSTVYAGGDFTTAGGSPASCIAQWNGSSWSALGSGVLGANSYSYLYGPYVNALAVSGGTLYAGGSFTNAGGIAATNIAQWNGGSWSALGSGVGGSYAYVSALAVSGGTLYAGGDFTTAGGNPANNIAQWNGGSWSALGSGVNSTVHALAVSGSTVYAGGDFTTAGGSPASRIAQWNGSSWLALDSGIGGSVYALAVSGSTLYAGGWFSTAGGSPANNIAQWNGNSWSALGSGTGGGYPYVYALVVSDGTLYAGGDFITAGGIPANYIAQWNGGSWSVPGSGMNTGMNGDVYALAVSGGLLYAGGAFTAAGGGAANNIAQWNGSSWSALGSGINGNVQALAVSGSTLYAGGAFSTAGGSTIHDIAQWNGSSWSALGSGVNSGVSALAVSGSTLYASGRFTAAGSATNANCIAQWNGSSWSALGSGMSGSFGFGTAVYALVVSGGTLCAGGDFKTAGGGAASCIAQWNGSSWSALGSGISGVGSDGNGPFVMGLAVSGSTVYAGGEFTTAGGSPASCIAQWNGSSWSALGSGVSGAGYYVSGYAYGPSVNALAVWGGTLYAGGSFTNAGGIAASCIAQWNGSSWSALGSGLSGAGVEGQLYVGALSVSGSTLYAGGDFTTSGTNVFAYAAMANLAGTPVSPALALITANAAFSFTNGVFGFDVAGPAGSNVVIQASTNLQTWIPLQTNLLGSGLLHFSDAQSPANRHRFYRAQLSP
jgi:hypothetical protein